MDLHDKDIKATVKEGSPCLCKALKMYELCNEGKGRCIIVDGALMSETSGSRH